MCLYIWVPFKWNVLRTITFCISNSCSHFWIFFGQDQYNVPYDHPVAIMNVMKEIFQKGNRETGRVAVGLINSLVRY